MSVLVNGLTLYYYECTSPSFECSFHIST